MQFDLDKPGSLTIEINDDITKTLHLFAGGTETETPDPDDPNVVYYGPGIHKIGRKEINTNQTVYLAGGAYVYGNLVVKNRENVRIRGRGILDGSPYDRWENKEGVKYGIHAVNTKNLTIEGIILLDPVA